MYAIPSPADSRIFGNPSHTGPSVRQKSRYPGPGWYLGSGIHPSPNSPLGHLAG